jgi:hypothetical protein
METVIGWAITCMWAGVATWVFFDARGRSRAPISNAIATFVLPGLGLAVYLGTRQADKEEREGGLSPNGSALLRDMTAEVRRLRGELATEKERADDLAERLRDGSP